MNAGLLTSHWGQGHVAPLLGTGKQVTGSDHDASRRVEDLLARSQLRGSCFINSGWTEAFGISAGLLTLGHSPRPFQDRLIRRGGALLLCPSTTGQLHWNPGY